jgi:hypothetical protein
MLRLVLVCVCVPQGGNAVLGYQQSFDLARGTGQIVARALGTACRIAAVARYTPTPTPTPTHTDTHAQTHMHRHIVTGTGTDG